MTLSAALATLSLLGFVAMFAQALWKTREQGKNSWGLYNHGFDKMRDVIDYALKYCLNTGFIIIEDRKSDHFIQFRKYILRTGEYGLELSFPEAPWSATYFPKLREALTAEGTPFRETRESGDDPMTFIYVDCGRDLDKAVGLARLCFFGIFGLPPDVRFRSRPHDYSSIYDVVDDPDYEDPLTTAKWWSAFRQKHQREGMKDPALALRGAVFVVGWLASFVALWISWFVMVRTDPSWDLDFGPIRFAGSDGTLVALLLFVFFIVGLMRAGRRMASYTKPRPTSPVERISLVLINYGLPLAVVASWMGW